jgi:predicted translin family RNA/ssDNA-binding protein
MIPDFSELKTFLDRFIAEREQVILTTRVIIKESKLAIYSVHRKEMKQAAVHIKTMEKELEKMMKLINGNPKLLATGSHKPAIQEYVEAKAYYQFMKDGTLPSYKEFDLDEEYYLMGICDLTGELVRQAVNSIIAGDSAQAEKIRAFVDKVYGQFLHLDLQNGELRKKFDSIKYDLKKLEELCLQVKLKK